MKESEAEKFKVGDTIYIPSRVKGNRPRITTITASWDDVVFGTSDGIGISIHTLASRTVRLATEAEKVLYGS